MEEKINLPVEYSAAEARLADMRGRLAGRVWDVTTGRGMDEARAARAELRTARVALEDARTTFKAPLLDACRRLDNECKRITGEIVLLEKPIDAVIKAEEGRKERARIERELAEKARIQAIVDRIQVLAMRPPWNADLAYLEAVLERLRQPLAPEDYQEMLVQAQDIRTASLIWFESAVGDMKQEIERRRARAEAEQETSRQLEIEKFKRHQAEAAAEEAQRQAAEDRKVAEDLRAEAAAIIEAEAEPVEQPHDPEPEPETAEADPLPTVAPGTAVRVFKVTRGRIASEFVDEIESIISMSGTTDSQKVDHIRLTVEAVVWGKK